MGKSFSEKREESWIVGSYNLCSSCVYHDEDQKILNDKDDCLNSSVPIINYATGEKECEKLNMYGQCGFFERKDQKDMKGVTRRFIMKKGKKC